MHQQNIISGYYWLCQEYQTRPLVKDNIIYPASEPAKPAQASQQSGDEKNEEKPGECTSRETKEAVSYTNDSKVVFPTDWTLLRNHIGYKPEESGTEIADLLDELKDVNDEIRYLQDKAEKLVSRLQEAFKQTIHKTLHTSSKLVRWVDSTGTSSPNDDTHRARKRARRSSLN